MDFSQLNKVDLVNIVKELTNKVEAQQHLASAIDAKDREIAELRKYKEEALKQKHLADSIIQKDKEIIELTKLYQETKAKIGSTQTLETRVKQLETENKGLTDFLNPYIMNFRSSLKGIQGTLELAVEMEAMLSEKLTKK